MSRPGIEGGEKARESESMRERRPWLLIATKWGGGGSACDAVFVRGPFDPIKSRFLEKNVFMSM